MSQSSKRTHPRRFLICQHCTRIVVVRSPKTRRFCSESCRKTAAAPTWRCQECGTTFKRRPNRGINPSPVGYCSPRCRDSAQRWANGPRFTVIRIADCGVCGSTFVTRDSKPRRLCGTRVCVLEDGRRAYHATYVPAARQCVAGCGRVGPQGQGRYLCEQCRPAQLAKQTRAMRRRRRARKRGVKSEHYTLDYLLDRDANRCQLCGERVHTRRKPPHPKAPVIDHIIPLAQGGDDTRANVQIAHFICNSIKGDRTAPDGDQLRLVG